MEVLRLTPRELTEKTIKDLAKRKEIRAKGIKEAERFVIERSIKTNKALRESKKGRLRF